MDVGNETSLMDCRFLSEDYFTKLYEAFIEAFSDYVVPFALTEAQFRNHIVLNAVDLERTVGCLDGDKLTGFSLNGFGEWEGRSTVYDAGTGVIPSHRRQGISKAMFDLMLPVFEQNDVEQFLLEVVTSNTGAIALYKNLGFRSVRELALMQCDGPINSSAEIPRDVEICEIDVPDWGFLTTFWDGKPSWQNSTDAVMRSLKAKRILGAYVEGICCGYVVFSLRFGRVAQMAVARPYRDRGIATALLRAMQAETDDGNSLQVVNIDKSLTAAMNFLRNRGFTERLSQHEMIKPF